MSPSTEADLEAFHVPDLDMATIDRSRSNWDKESKISEFWIAGGGERKLNKREKIRESSKNGASLTNLRL